MPLTSPVRVCASDELQAILDIINDAAGAYATVLPPDLLHQPYMTEASLRREIEAGVVFYGTEAEGRLIGIMGLQRVKDVQLIRHAYVRTAHQGVGAGRLLLNHIMGLTEGKVLVGTWRDAQWAIAFYQANGFTVLSPEVAAVSQKQYWTISDRQIELSTVLERVTDGLC